MGKSKRRGQVTNKFSDWYGGVLKAGESKEITVQDIAAVSGRDRSFAIRGWSVQVAAQSGSACWQFESYSPLSNADGVLSTGPQLVATTAREQRVDGMPTWYTSGTSPQAVLARMDCICQIEGDSARIRFVVRLDFLLRTEEFTKACPKLALRDTMEDFERI